MSVQVSEIKSEVLPALFRNPTTIGEYGRTAKGKDGMNELSELMEGSPVGRLANALIEITAKLADADPRKIAKTPTWLERFTGKQVETHVLYQVARKSLDVMVSNAEGAAQGVRDTIEAINRLMESHGTEADNLQAYLQAGREFLAENPETGAPTAGSIEFDNPRERFARKLANLATLLYSHQLSVTQMKLTKAQAVDMLDRFEETSQVLLPVWRQHTLTLMTTKHMSPAMVAEATKAHEALMRSLAQGVNGLNAQQSA